MQQLSAGIAVHIKHVLPTYICDQFEDAFCMGEELNLYPIYVTKNNVSAIFWARF